ncbi:MAG: HlyC/CorC family transporter [Methanobrevibacter arboriphilus]|uniref:HlyC/CorC family transporter n=1 Tax=Methanobrevibacter arboriphilus TaxID=39441 RepID=A0A843AM75_METAZ|nr:hemolysin family protein [Methanobrevibacter arboriphilus]MBF4468429.1 HlyC/CorC family transporter [Methanobrevibacter arboriphilus]
MYDTILEIIIILILIVLNGVLAMSELAIVSSRRSKLQQMANEGKKHAKIVIELIDDPNQFLSTIQIGITLIGILAGAFGGATLAEPLSQNLTFLGDYANGASVIIVVLIITYLSLVIGELVPKRIALNNPENIAVRVAKYMKILSKVCGPLVKVLSSSTNFILKIIGSSESKDSIVTEDEIKMLIEEGIEDGTIEKEEEDIIKRVFRLDEQKVDMLMTPKNEIIWIDLEESLEESKKKIIESERSIFPVAEGDLDNLLGVAQAKDILSSIFKEENLNIKNYLKKPLIVPENLPSLDILKLFKENLEYVHIAIVVDEYGSVEGLITLNDILEGIVGDIPGIDEMDEPNAIERKDGSWLIDSGYSIDRFKELFEIEDLNEEEGNFTTLAGFILSYLNKIPETGEEFSWKNFDFEIVDMDGHHIDKILVIKNEIKNSEEKTSEERDN